MVPPVRAIAFYLPQFHPIPENDRWWGRGFTEWTNVARARPNFRGHQQPHLPADLGFYDLRLAEVREAQAGLALESGIHGFCYYHYWFAGRKLLDRPLREVLTSGRPDFPFCVCWANESWGRGWDGLDQDILIKQRYSRDDDLAFIRDLVPYFRDHRYVRVGERPLLIVYRVGQLPDAKATASIWREECAKAGVGEIYLCAVRVEDTVDPAKYGFDALVEFPPHRQRCPTIQHTLDVKNPKFRGNVFDYRCLVIDSLAEPPAPYTIFRAVMPGWDNTARRQDDATIFLNSSPEIYEVWLRGLVEQTIALRPRDERLVFINAWNEWAEAAYLEPDQRHGRVYLEATRRALVKDGADRLQIEGPGS
jgi:lipopolysaccharide biosynthesis protein